ncbi:MAG: 2-dehydro-3-deoxy-D-gluconate 5-dehydrogenase KduD [Spirochaetes bacterium]|nr:2-dehydro-3-deoxy-D-gluconate 5-dehydrogenase KduD [Spirochaetota bacterium]
MVLDDFKLDGKVAIVTGCNTGLGQAIAIGLAEAGAHIAGVARRDATETKEAIQALGRQFHLIRLDLLEPDAPRRIVQGAMEAFGQIDILVNNAGIIRRNDALEYTEEDWDAVMNTNLKVLFFLSQEVAKQFLRQGRGGKIINIASMLSFQGGIRIAAYTASKSGVLGITRILANEWAKYGINVNAIAPGYMETNNTLALRQDEKRNAEILSRIPAGRWGKPEDLKGAAVFLASAASNYVHGYAIAVDGGWLAR